MGRWWLRHGPWVLGMWLLGCASQPPPPSPITPFTAVKTDAGGFLLPEQAAYDVQHYDLALIVEPDSQTIAGTLTVRASVLETLEYFVLDLTPDLTVHATHRIDPDGAPVALSFDHGDGRIWIELDRPHTAGETVLVAVDYGGSPRVAPLPPWVGGFTWSRSDDRSPWVGVSCQVDGADLWWPCKEHPSDEPDAGVTLHYTVPESLYVPANGRLQAVEDNGDGTRTFHWEVGQPINTYDVTFNAGPFVELTDSYASVSGDTIPVFYWVLPEHEAIGRTLFADFLDFLAFLEGRLGPYPFRSEKCGMVETPYLAMEHQTVIAYGHAVDDTLFGFHETMLHELGHEWWGNLVSARGWNDFWLHEGFDGYLEALYTESIHGAAGYHEYMARVFRPPILNRLAVAPRDPRTIRQMFHAVPPDFARLEVDIYAKGAWVLHTLRYLLGDEVFFEVLRRWAYPDAEHEGATDGRQCRIVTTDDFVRLAEAVSGRNLDWFFEVYLRQPVLPKLVTTRENGVLLVQWEVPEGLHFPMPIEVAREGGRSRVDMPGGRGEVTVEPGEQVELDPDFWILRTASPDPDQFGTIGAAGGPGPGSRQGQREDTGEESS